MGTNNRAVPASSHPSGPDWKTALVLGIVHGARAPSRTLQLGIESRWSMKANSADDRGRIGLPWTANPRVRCGGHRWTVAEPRHAVFKTRVELRRTKPTLESAPCPFMW